MHDKLLLIQTPLTNNALGYLRNSATDVASFRKYADILTSTLVQYSIQPKDLVQQNIATPLDKTVVSRIVRPFIALPILRSGLSMLPAFLEICNTAKVGFAGLVRDETTAQAREYYWKIPKMERNDVIVILDPMIATGGSVLSVLRKLRIELDNEIRIVSIISSQPGITAVMNEFPEVSIVTAAVDGTLNAQKYIVPGLGDFGDRYFGTELYT